MNLNLRGPKANYRTQKWVIIITAANEPNTIITAANESNTMNIMFAP